MICVTKNGVSVRLSRMKPKTKDAEKKKNKQTTKKIQKTHRIKKKIAYHVRTIVQVQPVFNAFQESPVLYLISFFFLQQCGAELKIYFQ